MPKSSLYDMGMSATLRLRSILFIIGNSRNTFYDKDMNFYDIFIKNGQICMGFEADKVEKVQKLAYLIRSYEKMSDKKLIHEQRVKILVDLQ